MVLKELVLQNGLGSGCIVRIVQNLERYFPYWWPLTAVNECICWKFMSFWVDFWRFSGVKLQTNEQFQKFVTFRGEEMLEIHTFCGFLDEFSAWSHELQWRCRISFPSVTGKVQNLWRIYMKFCKVGQF